MIQTKKQKGVGLVELSLVITMVTVIVASIFSYNQKANESIKVNDLINSYFAIQDIIHRLFPLATAVSNYDFTGLNETMVATSGGLPGRLVNGNDVITQYGDIGITIEPPNPPLCPANRCNRLTYQDNSLPISACVYFLSSILNKTVSITVNGNAVNSIATIANECSTDIDGDGFSPVIIVISR